MNIDIKGTAIGVPKTGFSWTDVAGLVAWTAAAFCVGAFALPLLALPLVAMMMPAVTLWAMSRTGWLACPLGAAALSAGLAVSMPVWVMWLPVVIVMPPVALFASPFTRRMRPANRVMTAAGLLGACAVAGLAIIWANMGVSPEKAALAALENWLSRTGRGDALIKAYQYGLARMRGSPFAVNIGDTVWIRPSHARELTNSLLQTARTFLSTYLPQSVISGAIACAAVMASIVPGDEPVPFRSWKMTEGAGGALITASAALFAVSLLSGGSSSARSAQSAAGMAALRGIISVQGAAVIESTLAKRSVPKPARMVLIGLCFVIFGMVCFYVGLADALFNLRRLSPADERSCNP